MTNERYGAAININDIDTLSFYDASRYCDEGVRFFDHFGVEQTRPRFRFSTRIADRPEIFSVLKAIAGSFNGNLIFWNGKWTLIQDRPTPVSKLVTKANTLEGAGFKYKSTPLYGRHTVVNVSYNDATGVGTNTAEPPHPTIDP